MEDDVGKDVATALGYKFQSTSSVWRTTDKTGLQGAVIGISIHVLRVEDDEDAETQKLQQSYFNPRPPCGGRLCAYAAALNRYQISIHVLRVEDDAAHLGRNEYARYFNPRPPCGGRLASGCARPAAKLFQSTSSVWRTTYSSIVLVKSHSFQSTSSVWRTTSNSLHSISRRSYFNPRPPCGGRLRTSPPRKSGTRFQSTSSVWRTTESKEEVLKYIRISIHVLRVEDDVWEIKTDGESKISIHVLRVEDDATKLPDVMFCAYFNPRPPCGGRPGLCSHTRGHVHNFNPRPPCGGRPTLVC